MIIYDEANKMLSFLRFDGRKSSRRSAWIEIFFPSIWIEI